MSIKVVIDMKNPNALIAMAQVSQNADNPYFAFCEYIKYCVFANPCDTMSLSDIRTAVGAEFGIYIPHNIALKCLYHIQSENLISFDNHQIKRTGDYDTEEFNRKRESYRATETELIKALIVYVKQYNKEWDYEYAREQLIKVLDRKGLAYDIFVHGEISTSNSTFSTELEAPSIEEMSVDEEDVESDEGDNQPLFTDGYYVGNFIEDTLKSSTVQRDYLLKICEGLMLCVGAYQLPSAEAELVPPQIKGTNFLFDTRLLLRFVGCAGDAAVEAAQELVKLIQGAGGTISYYSQTVEEIERAFDEAIKSISYGYPPRDSEMRLFASKIGNNLTLLKSKKASIRQELASAGISLKPSENYSNKDNRRFGFERSDLQQFMEGILRWDRRTIENDAISIWETHMKRRGNYSEYFGGSNRLPVFVTSNAKLIGTALHFRNQRKTTSNIFSWKPNRLPVITDMRLTCRLWSPSADSERLSLLYLTCNAVAAQNLTQKYIRTVRELAIKLEETSPEYSGISLPSYFDENVTKTILKNTKGQDEQLNIGSFTSSLNELSELKAKEQEEKTIQIAAERDEISAKFDFQTQAIIEGAVEYNKNKLGLLGVMLKLILWWPAIGTLIFAGITALVSWAIGNWHVAWITLLPVLLKMIELVCSSQFVERWILKAVYSKAEQSFKKRIERKLRLSEIPYKETIVPKVMEETKLWGKVCSIIDK